MIDGLGAGADDYISKSSEFEVLRARVARRSAASSSRTRTAGSARSCCARSSRPPRRAPRASSPRRRAALVDELERKNKRARGVQLLGVARSARAAAQHRRLQPGAARGLRRQARRTGRDYLARVRAAAQRMGELIDDLLELSRVGRAELTRGARRPRRRWPAPRSAELARSEPERRIEIVDRGRRSPRRRRPRLMRVVLENLLGNAWKFTAQAPVAHGSKLACEASETAVRRTSSATTARASTWPTPSKLFRPFQRLHNAAEFPGTGIGLATVHRIIDRHGGRMWAEGAVGVRRRLPLHVRPSGARRPRHERYPVRAARGPRGHAAAARPARRGLRRRRRVAPVGARERRASTSRMSASTPPTTCAGRCTNTPGTSSSPTTRCPHSRGLRRSRCSGAPASTSR